MPRETTGTCQSEPSTVDIAVASARDVVDNVLQLKLRVLYDTSGEFAMSNWRLHGTPGLQITHGPPAQECS